MTELSSDYRKENRFEFIQDFTNFEFSVGYSYTAFEWYRNLVHITFMFWHLNYAW